MNPHLAQFEAKVRTEWLDDATVAAWARWHDKCVAFWHEFTDRLLAAAQLAAGHRVLDLASGTGDPALMVAARVGPAGHVVATDLAPQMLAIARANADRAGLRNLSFEPADAHSLPYADASFDRVTCRLGVMFFWDCPRALREIRRVLKPGGVATFLAWGPAEEQDYMRTAMAPFKQRRPPPAPPPGAPTPYRFGLPGSLGTELRAAGFSAVREDTHRVGTRWPGPPDELWTRLYECSAPMRPYFDSFSPDVRAAAIREAIAGLAHYYDGREVVASAVIIVATGTA
ncbi:MAG TPA: methyltransferase domain-containing protein [Opitutus sp.]|nr:methyltransferase domain-containing protein [Opitutus sp.]